MQASGLSYTAVHNPEKTGAPVKVISVQYQKLLNLVIVRGSSIGDQSAQKYERLMYSIDHHLGTENSLHLYFNFDFLDSSALAYMATIISSLNEYHSKGKNVKLFWSCLSVAENMGDEGTKLKALCKFEFHL